MFWKRKTKQNSSKAIAAISEAWGWTGISPVEIIHENNFGNLIIKDEDGRYWRLCPEDVYCRVIANSASALESLMATQDFQTDWVMEALVSAAHRRFGPLLEGQKYCLKIPGVAGGSYSIENIGTNSLLEIIGFSGSIGYQIKDLPDGTLIQLNSA